jgi:hypothetical protein
MPISYRYDESANRILTRCEGGVVLEDIAEHFRRLGRDSRLRPHCEVLLDLSFPARLPGADEVDEVTTIIEGMADLMQFGRCALVAPEAVEYSLGRMFQEFAWPLFSGMRMFRTESAAIAWLNEES